MTPTPSEYLVQYGRPAFVGRFVVPPGGPFDRGSVVVVRTPRGVELGTVMCEPAAKFAHLLGANPDGELLRPAGPDDLAGAEQRAQLGRVLIAAADRLAAETDTPVTFLDAEVFLDGASAVLHAVTWGDTDLTPLLDAVSSDVGLTVRLHDAARVPVVEDAPEPAAGCGKPDCGSGSGGCSSCGTGGGCGTNSCSSGKVKSADELTAYFADLRRKMDAQFGNGRTPLH